jgi:outer membrane lipoprotein LolB
MAFTVRPDYYAPMRAVTSKQFNPIYSVSIDKSEFYRALLFLWVLLLGACSSLPDAPVTEDSYNAWASYQAEQAGVDSWEIHARSAVFVNEEIYHFGINWQRQQNHFTLIFEAPLGQGVFRVESFLVNGQSEAVMLTMPDGQKYFDKSAEALLFEVLGWAIPVSGLEWWIKGLPQDDTDYSFDLRADGRPRSLLQNDWKINYLDYFDLQSPAHGLPRKMYLKHPDLALKIVIERWHQNQQAAETPVLFPEFD